MLASVAVLSVFAGVHGSLAGSAIYHGVEFAAVCLAWWGTRRQPPLTRPAMGLVALGVTLYFLGDVSWWVQAELEVGADVAPSDGFYLAGYVALAAGLWRLAGTRDRGRDEIVAGWIDALVVFVAGLALVWQLSLASIVSDAALPVGTRLVWSLYPALDAALIGLVIRLLVQRSRGELTGLTVAAGAAVWMVCDLGYLLGADAELMNLWLDAGWMVGAVLLALSTLPQRSVTPRPESRHSLVRSGLSRLAVCLGALLVPAAMEFVLELTDADETPGLVLIVTLALTALVFVRASLLVRGEAAARARVSSQQRYSAALAAHSSDAVVVLGRDGRLLSDPATLPVLFQVSGDEPVESGDLVRLLGADPQEAHVLFRRALQAAGEVVDGELMCERGGVPFWIGARVVDLSDHSDVGGVVVHVTDITDRKRAEEALAHQAFHDALTGLANRALFADRVEQALRRSARGGGRPAVVFIDLDGFKGVNDTLGHPAGDTLLREVAARLRSVVRLDDTVARLGGDEFALLVEQSGTGPDEAVATAERVLAALAEPIALDGQSVTVSGSVGIAVGEADATSDSLVGDADIAMYAAKMAGRGRSVVFDSGMRASAVAARELEQELQGALAAGEFRLVYQPVIDLADGSVTGFEALLRWDSPVLGPVSPTRFVPVAEASGLIEEIGSWALREACATAAAWRAEHGRDLTMAVNVSAVQLTSPHLVDHIVGALTASGLPPAALVLEVTETALVEDPDRASECLAALRALGLRLALDDFGTGYSSLAHLRQFTVDVLKIDRSFVATIGEDGVMPPIVRGMIDLGRTLGLEIVAEGVETEAQRQLLVDGRCDLAQGHLFARALEPADASLLLLSDAARTGA
ncbi:bifunctional diguanylate cyclase/phosphodiesterase [Blastococcus sp. TF02A-26]|uniref:putative bifunctional diguanylate cyclase/phosphodiesterase n=1 Tax=Blastococcus sp. TF02A-26 TaxID=2250577 RepID=UPI0011BDD817|nr:bifunctional diguanylate cyclase/phosphodiesterase [Blastococcus sp. TF02A-26]